MCNPYRATRSVESMRGLFGITSLVLPEAPIDTEIHPDKEALVVRDVAGVREITVMRWGFPPPVSGNRSVTNVRRLSSRFWRTALSNPSRRCLVVVNAFSEWAETPSRYITYRRRAWIALPDRPLFAFAGVWQPTLAESRFAILTVMANAFVSNVHLASMPVILAEEEQDQWLAGTFFEACALADAYPDAEMQILP